MTIEAVLDPDVPKDGKRKAQRVLDEFIKVAKGKGHTDIEKVLFRGVIDEFTISKAQEMGEDITTQEFMQALNNAGFDISGITKMEE